MPLTRLTIASVTGGAAAVVRGMTIEQCHDLVDFFDGLVPGVPLPRCDYAPFERGDSLRHTKVLPLLRKRITNPNPRPDQGGNVFQAVKSAVRLEDFAARFTTLEGRGDRLRGRCPLHSERSPSFTVYLDSQRWHCFGACGVGGDVIMLAQKLGDRGLL